jgi:predicted permease
MNPLSRVMALFRRKRLDAEMAEEMRLHVEMQTERNIARGMDAQEARYAAQRLFGGVEQIKETARAQRGMMWLEDAFKDLRFALRMLRKNFGFTVVAVVSLAIGIGLNTAVFSIINTIFYQTIRGVPEPERVLFFNESPASQKQLEHLMSEAEPVARLTGAQGLEALISLGGYERRQRVLVVPTNYFSVMDVPAARGRLFSDSTGNDRNALPEAVLSYRFWQSQMNADRSVIGRTVRINGIVLTIVGVAARDFHGPGPEGPPLWIPLSMRSLVWPKETSGDRFGIFGRLNPQVELGQAQAAINLIVVRAGDLFPETTRYRLSVGREDWRGEVSAEKRIEFILVTTVPLVIAGGLLWIACSNVGNLLLARAVQRRKEIAIRVASGASRARLVRMLMSESIVLAILGGGAGLWVATVTIDFVFATLAEYGAFSVQLDERVFVYTAAVSVVAAFVFGLVPAWEASKADVNQALKGESGSPAFRSSRLRGFFLVTQIATSFALLVIAGTFVKSLVAEAYVGEQARSLDRLLIAEVPASHRARTEPADYRRELMAKVLSIPKVETATFTDNPDVRKRAFSLPGDVARPEHRLEVFVRRIDGNFFEAAGITLQSGMPLSPEPLTTSLQSAVINEAMARRFWSIASALDQRFQLAEESYVVGGVVRDGRTEPLVYIRLPLEDASRMSLLIRSRGRAEEVTALIQGVLHGVAPEELPPRVTPLRETAFRTLSQLTRLALYVGGLALALAAAGIYASMAFSTSQRTQEIGVRMALGATRAAVLRLVLGSGLKVVLWGCALGLLVGIVGLRLLFAMLSGRSGFDAFAIGGVIIFFAVIAAAACLVPALRATKVDPMVALRSE